jgi:hypothetical protein
MCDKQYKYKKTRQLYYLCNRDKIVEYNKMRYIKEKQRKLHIKYYKDNENVQLRDISYFDFKYYHPLLKDSDKKKFRLSFD